MSYIAQLARSRGFAVTECPEPLNPKKTEAVLIPEKGLCFASFSIPQSDGCRCIDAPAPLHPLQSISEENAKYCSLSDELIASACERLKEAKLLHDRLEAISSEYMDYDALNAFTGMHLNDLFKN